MFAIFFFWTKDLANDFEMRPPRKINVGFTKIRLSKFVIHEEWPFADKRNLDQRPYNTYIYIYVCVAIYTI